MRFIVLAALAAMAYGAPAAAQEFTSRALPPEMMMDGSSSIASHLDSGVYVIHKGFGAMRMDGDAPAARPQSEPQSSLRTLEANVGCIAQAVYHEARGEVLTGQQAVADVVMNRVRSGKWSGNACGVIHAKGQFQGSAHWPTPRPGEPLWDRAIAVARAAASGTVAVSARLMSFRAGHTHSGVRIGHQVFF